MDTTRIAAAVQASRAQRLAARRVPARVARLASLSLILVLGAIGVWASRDSRDTSSVAIQTPVANAEGPLGVTAGVPVAGVIKAPAVQAPTQLAMGGDMSQLEDEDLLALMDELSALEAMPGEEPASLSIEPVVPVDQEEL